MLSKTVTNKEVEVEGLMSVTPPSVPTFGTNQSIDTGSISSSSPVQQRLLTVLVDQLQSQTPMSKEEIEIMLKTIKEYNLDKLKLKNDHMLALCGAISGMLAGAGVIVYSMFIGEFQWAIPGIVVFGFGVSVTPERAKDAFTSWMKFKMNKGGANAKN